MHHPARLLLAVLLIVLTVLIAACGASKGDLEKTQAELAQAKTELAAAVQAIEDKQDELSGDLTDAQGTLTQLQGELKNVTSEAAGLKSTVTGAQAELSTGRRDLSSLSSQLGDLKNSFTLTRDEVAVGKDKVDKLETSQATALRLARLSLVFDLYANFIFVNSESDSRAALLAIGSVVNQANDPGLAARWNPLAKTFTDLFDGKFTTADEFARARSNTEDPFLTYLRTVQEQVLASWK